MKAWENIGTVNTMSGFIVFDSKEKSAEHKEGKGVKKTRGS